MYALKVPLIGHEKTHFIHFIAGSLRHTEPRFDLTTTFNYCLNTSKGFSFVF